MVLRMEYRWPAEASDVQDRAEQLECIPTGILQTRFLSVLRHLQGRCPHAASCVSLSAN